MNRARLATLAIAAGLSLLTFGVTVPGVDAHERRTVAGRYTFVVGFLNEPAIAGQVNGVSLAVTDAQSNAPVEGVDKALKADVTVSGETKTYELRPRFGQAGSYSANLIPTKTGTWVFRFYGSLNGTAIDERFESGPGRFNDVESPATLEFPAVAPARGDAAAPASTNDTASADVQRAVDEAKDARRTGLTVGAAGIALGVLGVALAAVALMRKPAGGNRSAAGGRGEPV